MIAEIALDNPDNPFQLYLAKTRHTSGGVTEPATHHKFPWGLFHSLYPSNSSVLSLSLRSLWRESQQGSDEIHPKIWHHVRSLTESGEPLSYLVHFLVC